MRDYHYPATARFNVILILLAFAPTAMAGDGEIPDPGKWYAESYGPVWLEEPWNKADEAISYYHSEIMVHEPDGEFTSHNTAPWIKGALAGWEAEGWLGSHVPDIQVNRINKSTVSFTTRWLDHYKEAEDEYSCAWYMADLMEGQWKFTHYAPMDCASIEFGD